ncbi:recombinase family protein [Allosphingosinicella sp.]|uniref:recombinase family protein n=1 Tax=Allosphingosinicella sp. TaxID=2823234 RepID=UPI003783FFF8
MAREEQRRQGRATRCAIYTRKSTEEGLDQEFNSLDAQREACAAYVLSQKHEGWSLLPDYYDDGGFTGGNMDRPGLKRLLVDVQAGKVDVIVVYKVDRLTRALSDFSKIVDVLDAAGASFVSVTQAFNTTTSMGRLTLNVLLSFAQFEREVMGERVRDKIAASKRKGIWMGGPVPLGYDVVDRKLVINEQEAETVRHIFRRYLELGSVRELMAALAREGVLSKVQTMRDGSKRGGCHFVRGPLYCLLKNPIYAGQIQHHKAVYPGQHEALMPVELWDEVQALLKENGASRKRGTNAQEPSFLAGRIRDANGRPMVASHACKGTRRYRYYVTAPDADGGSSNVLRLPAGQVEALVRQALASVLRDTEKLTLEFEAAGVGPRIFHATARCGRIADHVPTMAVFELRELLAEADVRVAIKDDRMVGTYLPAGLAGETGADAQDERCSFDIPGVLVRRGHEARLVLVADRPGKGRVNSHLVALLTRSFAARKLLIEEAPPKDKAAANARKSELSRLARMSYLAPDIVQSIMDGTQPARLGARELLRMGNLPISWAEQRLLFGFAQKAG